MSELTDNSIRISGWACDMCRAINERNRLWKWLLRLCLGRYAYREYIGLLKYLEIGGFSPYLEYDLKQADYHKTKRNEFKVVDV